MKNTGNLGGTLETLDRVRGRVPLPDGLLSRDGWYLHDDSAAHLLVDGWATPRSPKVSGNTDWYFFGYGTDYRAALGALATVSGPVPMPRRYTLGSWYSRYWPYTSEEYRALANEYSERGYPLDVMVMDMDWHRPGWTGWSWNRALLPDVERLIEWFHDNKLAVTLNLHPADGVGAHEDAYRSFMGAIGEDAASEATIPFDAGDRRYMDALFGCVHQPLELGTSPCEGEMAAGVDFWWLDWQQDKFTRSIPDLTNLRWLNYLYFQHTSRHGKRGCSFSRWAGWGDHRHPVHFSGDAHTGWESLAFQVPFTAVAGNVGCFFWSHDIGGHFGPRLEEATTRWVQFGALSPALRLHSARSGVLDRRPWTYKPMYESAMRSAFRLRSELFPYIYTMARKCHTDTVGLCRPMYIDWPATPAAYENPQQYMFGDDILVAPVTSAGVGPKKAAIQAVWFPGNEATKWRQWATGEQFDGGTERLLAAEIDEVPMFVRGGSPIVTREATTRMATSSPEKMIVVCYPGDPGTVREFELYEDDGVSDAYERGVFATTTVRASWFDGRVVVEVEPRRGMCPGLALERAVSVELRGVESGSTVGGAVVERISNGVRVSEQTMGVNTAVRIEVDFVATDEGRTRDEHFKRRLRSVIGEDAGCPERGLALADHDGYQFNHLERKTVLGMMGRGFRPDGRTVHAYGWEQMAVLVVDEVGGTVERSTTVEMESCLSGRSAILLPEFVSEPKLGMTARRTMIVEHNVTGEVVRERYPLEQRTVHLRSFRVVGPYSYDPKRPMGPQRNGPELLAGEDRLRGLYIDMKGKPVTWMEAPPTEYWPQAIRKVCGGHNGDAMAYSMTHVWSPERQEVTLMLESGDRMELWIGDSKVFSSDGERRTESAVDEVRATLRKGWNQFLAKTNEGGGGWGFRVSIDGRFELQERFDI